MGIITSTALSLRDLQRSDNARWRLNRSPIQSIQQVEIVRDNSYDSSQSSWNYGAGSATRHYTAGAISESVDTDNTILVFSGWSAINPGVPASVNQSTFLWELTSGSAIRVFDLRTDAPGSSIKIGFSVLEFAPGIVRRISDHYKLIPYTGYTDTYTLTTAVTDRSKTMIVYRGTGLYAGVTDVGITRREGHVGWTDTTTKTGLTISTNNDGATTGSWLVGWSIVEFF